MNHADPFYRYRLPDVTLQQIKNFTTLVNTKELSDALHLPPNAVLGWVAKYLNTSCTYKGKEYRLRGKWSRDAVNTSLQQLQEHISCDNCSLPEYSITKSRRHGMIKVHCAACGYRDRRTDIIAKWL